MALMPENHCTPISPGAARVRGMDGAQSQAFMGNVLGHPNAVGRAKKGPRVMNLAERDGIGFATSWVE